MNTAKAMKVALVTGSSRGIGASVAERLAKDGFAVAVNYVAGAQEAEKVVAGIRAAGGTAVAVQGDVSRAADVGRLFDTIEQQLGKLDVLVNNAGILKTVSLADSSDADFDRTVDINMRGTFNTLREAAKRLNDGGRIVNFSSTLVAVNLPGYALYTASKAAVEAFTHIFSKELRGRNITVNAVAPGPVATALFLDGKTEEEIQTYAKAPPLQRLGQPEDIAAVVSFLAGPDGSWVDGQVLRVNGGMA